ncbi:MAG: acyltransferase family protein, partial [Muribaculaceae bacterium]|nr:acyltransferase family protein [Muribaculaceae bacterium]
MIKKEILGFDLAKILMAILIVAAHTQFLIEWPSARKILSFIGAAGVPMFFAISAYLFVSKLDNTTEIGGDKQILFHSLKRLAILFAIWYVLMLPMTYERFFTKVTMKETLYAILFT